MNYTYVNGNEMAWVYVSDAEAEDDDLTTIGQTNTFFGLSGILGGDDAEPPVQTEQDVTVAENTSEVQVTFANASTADAFEAAQTDVESGKWVPKSALSVEDRFVPVFAEEADVDYLDTDEDAYATISSGGDTLTVHNAGELVDDSEEVTMTMTGNKQMGLRNANQMWGNYDLSTYQSFTLPTKAFDAMAFGSDITVGAE
jgi:hypothetical protein